MPKFGSSAPRAEGLAVPPPPEWQQAHFCLTRPTLPHYRFWQLQPFRRATTDPCYPHSADSFQPTYARRGKVRRAASGVKDSTDHLSQTLTSCHGTISNDLDIEYPIAQGRGSL